MDTKASLFQKFRLFHKVAMGVMCLFFGLMIYVTYIAYSRGYSGTTKMDMSKVQQIRYNAFQQEKS